MICAGIDGGSRAIKLLLLDASAGRILARGVRDQGVDQDRLATELLDDLLAAQSLSRRDLARIVATGYARNAIRLAHTCVTEITCHAVGVRRLVPDARSVIEIGGQDSKILRLDPDGTVRDFAMNDRCAAGTGRFLEVVAARLDLPLADLGPLAARSTSPSPISSTCVVFAETELIGLLAAGTPRQDIVAGIQCAMARRLVALAGRELDDPVVFTGGVALLPGVADALRSATGHPITICPDPQFTGALGAALLAARELL